MFLVHQASLRVIHASVSKFETVKQAVFASRGGFVFARVGRYVNWLGDNNFDQEELWQRSTHEDCQTP